MATAKSQNCAAVSVEQGALESSTERWVDVWGKVFATFITVGGSVSRLCQKALQVDGKARQSPKENWPRNRTGTSRVGHPDSQSE